MPADRLWADKEPIGDFMIFQTLAEKAQHLALSRSEMVFGLSYQLLKRLGSSLPAQPNFPVEDGGNGSQGLFGCNAPLEQAGAAHPKQLLSTHGILMLTLYNHADGATEIDGLRK
ncbi:MAG TPA: hypothetical protein VKT49_12090 [Bryobacteraceae bacterium]|nr:hypothetical protein [Bryobacteraceae bacterium]